MHPLDKFARQVERGPKRSYKCCSIMQLSAIMLLVTSCQTWAPLSFIKKEPIYLENMTPSNVSLINSDPDTYKYKDNDACLPPIDLRKVPDVLAGIWVSLYTLRTSCQPSTWPCWASSSSSWSLWVPCSPFGLWIHCSLHWPCLSTFGLGWPCAGCILLLVAVLLTRNLNIF